MKMGAGPGRLWPTGNNVGEGLRGYGEDFQIDSKTCSAH